MVESEKYIERKLVSCIKSAHGMCIKLLCDQLSGLPDRLCLMPGGYAFFVELKSTGKKPGLLQKAIHKRLHSLGFEVYVIDSINGLIELENKIIKRYYDENKID